jgi:hypothetical protein
VRRDDPTIGVSIVLSFLVVAGAGVALHPGNASSRPAEPRVTGPAGAAAPAEPASPEPAPAPAIATPQPPAAPKISARPIATAPAPPAIRPVARQASGALRRPPSAFTTVHEGESLADVALRVYGSEDAAERLWRFNRDQLAGPEEPLRPGMLLRTP